MNEQLTGPVYICRCEDVTLAEVWAALERGVTTMEEIKRLTRCGMGPCQGRTCRQLLARELGRVMGESPGAADMATYRPPVKPVKLGVLAGGE